MKRPFTLKEGIRICKDEQYEYPELGRLKFILGFWSAWIFKRICEGCSGAMMTGYYEREACNNCNGFGLQIDGIYYEPCWKYFDESLIPDTMDCESK